jgi:hypothetical protein
MVGIPLNTQKRTGQPSGPRPLRPAAQKRVKVFAINHTHKAILNRNINLALRWRDHPRGIDPCDNLRAGNCEVLNKARWYCAATGFNATFTVQQGNMMA